MIRWFQRTLLFLQLSALSLAGSDIRYEEMDVYSEIVERFSTTRVRSVITNLGNKSKELVFTFKLPKEGAFISKLTMRVGEKEYYGEAKEKAKARQEYTTRSGSGENVGLVESRGTELFQVSLNAGPTQQASFVLEYQQLLTRYQSKYRLDLNINPGKVVEKINVTIKAKESQGIQKSTVNTSVEISTKEESFKEVTVEYQPSKQEQLSNGKNGLAKDIFFEYDVVHPTDRGIGLAFTRNGYFVQFFSPDGLPRLEVNIVFVIDVSGSMSGDKIRQARESLIAVIEQLNDGDYIGIVLFESSVSKWKSSLVLVGEFRSEAIEFTNRTQASGATNLEGGVQQGLTLLKNSGGRSCGKILVLLTDGQPTAGVINPNIIVKNIIAVVGDSGISVNCLGFGENLDYQLLERLSLNNNGVTRRIYTGRDAADQLKGFYKEISSPVLCDLTFDYCQNVDYSSKLSFPFLFAGGEIVVVGKFEEGTTQVSCPVTVSGHGISSQVTFRGTVDTLAARDFPIERLVAYQRIRQLLESRKIEGVNATAAEQKALHLALKYNFVTDLTSLIVVQAGNYTNDTAEPYIGVKPKSEGSRPTSGPRTSRPISRFRGRISPFTLSSFSGPLGPRPYTFPYYRTSRPPPTHRYTPTLPTAPPTVPSVVLSVTTTPTAPTSTPSVTTPGATLTPTTYPMCTSAMCKANRAQLCSYPQCNNLGCQVTHCKACYWDDQVRNYPSQCAYKSNICKENKIRRWARCIARSLHTVHGQTSKQEKRPRKFKCLCLK